jgi:hypothetical protein
MLHDNLPNSVDWIDYEVFTFDSHVFGLGTLLELMRRSDSHSNASSKCPHFRADYLLIQTYRQINLPNIRILQGGASLMMEYRFTEYFEMQVLRKRPYIKKEWCIYVLQNAIRSELQEHNRVRFWAAIPELAERYLRVITLEDRVTIHNAFPDRRFQP